MKKIIIICAVLMAFTATTVLLHPNPAVSAPEPFEEVELVIDLPEDFSMVQPGDKLVIVNVKYFKNQKLIKVGYQSKK